MSADLDKLRELFLAALDHAPEWRDAYLDRQCGADSGLRHNVTLMLRLHAAGQGPLDRGPGAFGATGARESAELAGATIGPYKLIERLGEGGMGSVWMAQQQRPVKRLVALKFVKEGLDSKQVVARFEAERQALALMDHPNIATVLDCGDAAGLADQTGPGRAPGPGRPYFVMELVKGVPITNYCDQHRLTPRERLGLFVPVCQAVQHAHQKGVIHRDLKPGNVLVANYDGRPVPKVIDFGVAKAVGQSLTEKTLVTGFGAIVGTLEYMSPEQVEFNQLDIDTRSDVYSLGVLLYELLAGCPPFPRKELERSGVFEMLRAIREQEPTRPSTRLSTAEGLPALAASRGTDPARLASLVRGELDWIVMKALEKDRNRRYESANGFAADVRRYLADEPVAACPPTAGYRVRKFVRRYRWPVSAAVGGVVLLVAGVAGTTWGLVRAEHTRCDAVAAAAAERAARAEEAGQRRQAEEHFQMAVRAVDDYLTTVTYDPDLRQADFHRLRKRLLESAVPYLTRLTAAGPGGPVLEAERGRAHGRLASLHDALGERPEALAAYEKARAAFARLAADHPDVPLYRQELAGCLNNLGLLLKETGSAAEAEKALRAALAVREKLVAEVPAESKYRRDLAASHGNLGLLLRTLDHPVEAEAAFRAALTIQEALAAEFPTDPVHLRPLALWHTNLAVLLDGSAEAKAAGMTALKIREKLAAEFPAVPEYRRDVAVGHNNLGAALLYQGELVEAESAFRAAVAIQERLVAEFPTRPEYRQDLGRSRHNLGLLLARLKKWAEAEAAFRSALGVRDKLAADAPAVPDYQNELGATLTHLADVVGRAGQADDARRMLDRAARHHQRALELLPKHPAYRREFRTHYRTRADVLFLLHDHASVVEAADGLARHAVEPAADLYNAARRVSRCVPLAADEAALDEAGRAELAERYAARAVGLLRQAVTAGYRDAAHMKQDRFLDPLREREDFSKLLEEVEARRKQESGGR